jgi:general secretion pathway protein M
MTLAERADVLLEPLRRYQVAAADFLDQRTPRERQMLALMAGAIGLWLIYWLVLGLLLNPLEASRKSVQARARALQDILIIQSDYRRLESQVASLDRMIRSGRHGNVLSRLEMMASQAQIKDKITSMDPKSSPPNDLYRESVIEVRLKNVNLKQLVDYLFRIERASELLKIKRLRIKTRSDNPGYLDVNFRVSSFQPLPPGAQPAAGAAEGRQAGVR